MMGTIGYDPYDQTLGVTPWHYRSFSDAGSTRRQYDTYVRNCRILRLTPKPVSVFVRSMQLTRRLPYPGAVVALTLGLGGCQTFIDRARDITHRVTDCVFSSDPLNCGEKVNIPPVIQP